ncbi:MAG: GNAT family N-acetyltransferase [Elusimicrobia bacterium]|nr:GNAT family N-acetyltransferase [Elusimicrobiota bacterium]
MRSTFELIAATGAHAAALGAIGVQAWRETYAGQMPDEYLSGLDAVRRAAHWSKILASPGPQEATFLIRRGGEKVGFVSFGPGRGERLNGWGEIYALYLLKSHQRRGLGTALYRTAADRLVAWGSFSRLDLNTDRSKRFRS